MAYLDDVAIGVFGVGADSNAEERQSSVWTRNHLQDLHEVLLLPGTRHVPAADLRRHFSHDDVTVPVNHI